MQSKVVSIKELTTDNPTLCSSPRRVFNRCHECEQYKRFQKGQIKKLKCKPHINLEYLELTRQKRLILNQLKAVDDKIESL